LTEKQVRARHHLTNEAWTAMGDSDELVELVEAAKLRRIRTGATKRERAQQEIIDGPPILAKIMRDPGSNARHVIDAVKTLDGLASNGAEAAAAGAKFEITINLGADLDGRPIVEHYSKNIAIDASPSDFDTGVIAAEAQAKAPKAVNRAGPKKQARLGKPAKHSDTELLPDSGDGEGRI
jgi:hypothetical protein